MNYYKIKFIPLKPIKNENEIVKLLWSYMSCLYKNGQILKSFEIVKRDDIYLAFVTLPEDDALDKKYNNIYVTKDLNKINELFKLELELIGENLNEEKTCTCIEKPCWYMLYSRFLYVGSPIICGSCGLSVPLYKFPFIFNEKEYFSVLEWKEKYADVNSLFIDCLSDKFTYNQMNNVKSKLSKRGIEICKEFERVTDVPFYYFVYHYEKTPITCPICKMEWKLNDQGAVVDYRCDSCRLVADDV